MSRITLTFMMKTNLLVILIADILPAKYAWYISSSKATVEIDNDNEDNAWRVAGYSEMMPGALEAGVQSKAVRSDALNSAVQKIRLNDPAKINDVVCIRETETYTNYVCVLTDKTTYIVPFGSRPDFTGLENGKVYTVSETKNILTENGYFDHPEYDENGDPLIGGFGGGTAAAAAANTTANAQNRANFPILPITLIPAAAVAIAITVMLLVWNKRNSVKK